MIKFDEDRVLLLQQLIIESSGGEADVRDFDLLDSALESIFQTFDGVELYPDKISKGARLGYGLISNHAFVDGNKRIGMLVMLSFLEMSGIKIKYNDDDMINLAYSIADNKMSYEDLKNWLIEHKK